MRALHLTALALTLALLLLPDSGLISGPDPNAPQTSPAVPQAATPATIPASERARANPAKPEPRTLSEGQSLFTSQCAMCHGLRGNGKGDLVPRLGLKVPDFTDPKYRAKRTDGELYYIITQGHGQMPGEGDRLQAMRKWYLINYIRTMAPAPAGTP